MTKIAKKCAEMEKMKLKLIVDHAVELETVLGHALAVLPGQYENVIEALETITKERNELKVTNAACVQEISTMKSQLSDLNAKNQN